jgi:RNA polymerase sigma-70 factor (ECF subfamily)
MFRGFQDTPEERLLRLAAQGNKRAFGKLYEAYLDEIYRYVWYRVRDPLEAEDITEDVFLKTWEGLPRLSAKENPIENFRAWLYRIAHNLVVDFYRSRTALPLMEEHVSEDNLSPEETVRQGLMSQRLAKAIMTLEPLYKQIIILRFINQLSHKETALIMNISQSYTRVLQYRAIRKLKAILSREEG